ncbi:hypothetical protein ABZZ74_51720, partial [Streptomyces sp. NPDC006476]|uniref:hypothetical protein n=1 Tax=Streptomyces sp. NPDC006476 TaxID=3157175 RepID=UPI0033AFFCBB
DAIKARTTYTTVLAILGLGGHADRRKGHRQRQTPRGPFVYVHHWATRLTSDAQREWVAPLSGPPAR